ncbi:hypothetical protein ACFWBN_31555 [Streptomyces sp. NPDC059989]|uniref:hypothetical protein n=1 Tax=Streptomyces sp. NPDC059989 TaxID=3347026 RepID=UPI0036CF7F43
MNRQLRLLLGADVCLLLLTCTVAAWAGPQAGKASAPDVAAADAGPCDRVIGPAHDYCTRTPATTTATRSADAVTAGPTAAATATLIPAALRGRAGLLVFATVAIAGAIGLVLTVERRTR